MRLQFSLVALAALLLIAPSAMAVHGAPYVAKGTAVGPDGEVYTAQVKWTGWWTRTFEVTISAVDSAPIVQHEFRGYETWNGPVIWNTEFFFYRGCAADGTQFNGQCSTDGTDFELIGLQIIQITTQHVTMAYVGNYKEYQLVLYV